MSGYDPDIGFVIEFATNAELAAYDQGCAESLDAVERVLSESPEQRAGVSQERWQNLRERLYAIVDKARLYDWIQSQPRMALSTNDARPCLSFRVDGSKFYASHRLVLNGVQAAPKPTLKQTIEGVLAEQHIKSVFIGS